MNLTSSPDWLDHPVFIVGHPKSGTTLLAGLLDGHRELVVLPEETAFFPKIIFRFVKAMASLKSRESKERYLTEMILNHTRLSRFVKKMSASSGTENVIDFGQFESSLNNLICSSDFTHRDICDSIVLSFAQASCLYSSHNSYRAWVEKSPQHVAHVESLIRAYPSARFIQIVRDPRDNWVSYRVKQREHRVETFARNWRTVAGTGLRCQQALGRDRYFLLRYEDLVSSPEETAQEITEFIGISRLSRPLVPSKHRVPWTGNSMFGIESNAVYGGAVGRYLNYDDQREIAIIEHMTKAQMELFGYDRVHSSSARLRFSGILSNVRLALRERLNGRRWGYYYGNDCPVVEKLG